MRRAMPFPASERQTAFMQRAADFTNDAFVLHGETAVF
jgi:hypothetical protein